MTYEQAEMIVILEFVSETTILSQVQQQVMLAEMEAQCSRGRNTPYGDFVYYSGLIEGIKRASFFCILKEAKQLLREVREKKNNK